MKKIISWFLSFISPTNGSIIGIIWPRALLAGGIVFGFYNPTGYSLYHVLSKGDPTDAWIMLGWIFCAIAIIVLMVAAWKSFGKLGTFLMLAFFAIFALLAFQEGWVSGEDRTAIELLALGLITVYFTLGLAGAKIWRRLTGQVVTDEGDNIT